MAGRRFVIPLCAVSVVRCASVPAGRSAIDDVRIRGARTVDGDDVLEKIATAPSPKFLGLFRGVVYDYEVLDRFVLQRDLARVERYYRARGFYEAHARAGRVRRISDHHVVVEVVVEEGKPIVINEVEIEGLETLPPLTASSARRAAQTRLRKGERFEEDAYQKAQEALERALKDQGYAYARAQRAAAVDLVRHTADITLKVQPDRPAVYGDVRFEGLGAIPDGPVRRALDLRPGDTYSASELEAAEQAALDLGVFSSVKIVPELSDPPPDPRVVPLLVKVEPSKLRTLRLGGGIEFDAIKTDLHAIVGWEDRNFFGGLRHFSVDFKPGVVLYPLRINNFVAPNRLLPEERFRFELRQPGFIEARTSGFIKPEFNVYPVLLSTNAQADDPIILGYAEFKGVPGVDRILWKLYSNLNYNIQVDTPFTYKGPLDPALGPIVLSYPELVLQLDFRDDRVKPHRGAFFGNTLQVAGLGGDARDVKVQPEARGYVPLGRRFTLASRVSVGFLFPFNYREIEQRLEHAFTAAELTGPDRAQLIHDLQVLYFRGFFSGGPSTNRGYPLRGISPHNVVPFLTPEVEAQKVANECTAGDPSYDPERCSVPIGGFSLWEASLEQRVAVAGPLLLAAFCDASDVSPHPTTIRLDHPHLSCGFGGRYDTPVGPIRLDIGYRIPGLQVPEGTDPVIEGDPGTILGLPIAISFGVGEAF